MKNGKISLPDNETLEFYEEIGDQHILTTLDTPLRSDAFHLNDEEKIEQIQEHFKEIMNI